MSVDQGTGERTDIDEVIAVRGLSKTFSGRAGLVEALRDIDLSFRPGEFVSIIGPSGCGKSTLLRIVGGLLKPSTGTVTIRGESVVEAQEHKEIGFVFQQPALLPWRTIKANVELPLQVNRSANRGRAAKSGDMLDLVGLGDFAGAHPHQLSGGMQQRVAIARSLIFDPAVLLMDEPFGALDEITRASMRYELLRIWRDTKKTVLFVTHSIPEAVILSDRVVVITPRPGRIHEVLEIDIPRPRTEEVEASEPFIEYAEHLRQLLKTTTEPGSVGDA